MAKFIKQVGKVTIREAEPGDAVYTEGWTIAIPVVPTAQKNAVAPQQEQSGEDEKIARHNP